MEERVEHSAMLLLFVAGVVDGDDDVYICMCTYCMAPIYGCDVYKCKKGSRERFSSSYTPVGPTMSPITKKTFSFLSPLPPPGERESTSEVLI